MSTRRVDDLVRALGIEGLSKSEVSRMCGPLDAEVAAFRSNPVCGAGSRMPWMVRRRSLVMATAAGGLIIVVAVIAQTFWGVGFGPAPPPGAVRLHIATEAPRLFPFGCMLALLLPVRVASTEDELTLVSVETGQPVPVVWPSGFAAWRVGGRAELVARDGTVVGREGDELDNLGGGVGGDDIFHVCIVGGHP